MINRENQELEKFEDKPEPIGGLPDVIERIRQALKQVSLRTTLFRDGQSSTSHLTCSPYSVTLALFPSSAGVFSPGSLVGPCDCLDQWSTVYVVLTWFLRQGHQMLLEPTYPPCHTEAQRAMETRTGTKQDLRPNLPASSRCHVEQRCTAKPHWANSRSVSKINGS